MDSLGPKGVFNVIDRYRERDPQSHSRHLEEDLFLSKRIDTSIFAVDEYLLELFIKVKQDKESFLDSLATPLNRDPLEILMHLQNLDYDLSTDGIPYQSSVLSVELYLDNEKER